MKALTGIVAAAALSLAAGAKSSEQSEGRLGALATEADEQAEESAVRHGNVTYSVGYLGGFNFPEPGTLEGLTASAHFVPYEFIEGVLDFGIDAEASIYALLGDEAGLMVQQKAAFGLEVHTPAVSPFWYMGAGMSTLNLQGAYFTLVHGVDFNFGQAGEIALSLGIEGGWLFNGEDKGFYAALNLGLKI